MEENTCDCCPIPWFASEDGVGRLLSIEETVKYLNDVAKSQEPPEEIAESWICPDCPHVDSGLNRRIAQAREAGCTQEEAERLARGVEKTTKRRAF